jgi:hypothetical protein
MEVWVVKKKLLLLAIVGAVLLSAAPVLADGDFYVVAVGGGVGTKISSLPYTITTPGFYYVTGNLNCASGDGITVNSNDVTIDLMGFRLSGNPSGSGIYMNARKNVEIRNGSITGCNVGIICAGSSGANNRIINVRAEANNLSGIISNGSGTLIKGCHLADNGNTGMWVEISATIHGNVINNCGTGIYFNAVGNIIGNNVLCNSGQTGIQLTTDTNKAILMDQNTVGGTGTHYSGGSSATYWGANAGR